MTNFKKRKTIFWLVLLAEIGAVLFFISYFILDIKKIGIWEWVLFSGGFFGLLPFLTEKFIFKCDWRKNIFGEKFFKNKIILPFILIVLSGGISWVFLYFLDNKNLLKEFSFIKASSWILGTIFLVVFLDLFILPIIIFFREIFFRGWVFFRTKEMFGPLIAVFFQAVAYLIYEIILNWGKGSFSFGVFVFCWGIFLGILTLFFKTPWVSFFVYWGYQMAVDSFFLYKISKMI